MGKFLQKMFGFANRKRTKRNTGEEPLDWNRDCLSYDSSAAKLPYSYYPQGKRAVEPFVRILTEPLGLSQKIYHHPTGRQFFNEVEGFVINDKLTVLRYYGYGVYPGICKQLAVISAAGFRPAMKCGKLPGTLTVSAFLLPLSAKGRFTGGRI